MLNYFVLKFAQTISADEAGVPSMDADALLQNGLNLTYFIAGSAAVIVIVVGGIMYAISSGDAGKVAKAKNLLTYAIVGLVIVLSAFAITNFVIGRFN